MTVRPASAAARQAPRRPPDSNEVTRDDCVIIGLGRAIVHVLTIATFAATNGASRAAVFMGQGMLRSSVAQAETSPCVATPE